VNFSEMRHHLMAGMIERVARSPAKDAFVLRGGMLTREWVAPVPRPTRDLDFVGDFAFDRDDTARRFQQALACELDDGVRIDRTSVTAVPIWVDSGFPGVRLELALGLGVTDQRLSIDVGFNDPLVPPPVALAFRGSTSTVEVRACRPETQLAWKLHALAEMTTSWRPKDLADVWLIGKHVALDDAELGPAIVAAFGSRGYTRDRATGVLEAAHWATKTSRLRWAREPALDSVLGDVRTRFAGVLSNLPEWNLR
jgi:nucleotidyltransferase AbiEii toxin of type IV toxin-antitoxin system